MNLNVFEKLVGTIITSLAFAFEVLLFKVYFKQQDLSPLIFLSAFLLCFSGYSYLRFTLDNCINGISIASFILFLISIYIYGSLINRVILTSKIILLGIALLIILIYHSSLYKNILRGNIILKPLAISIVWLLLIFLYVNEFEWKFYFHQGLFIALLTIFFDIKTINTDPFSTLPKVLGITKTKRILAIFIILYALLSVFFSMSLSIVFIIISVLLLMSILLDFMFKDLWLYVFYDGVIILQSIIVSFTFSQ